MNFSLYFWFSCIQSTSSLSSFVFLCGKVSYIKAVDIYFIVSFVFVFSALMEYILVLLDTGVKQQRVLHVRNNVENCHSDVSFIEVKFVCCVIIIKRCTSLPFHLSFLCQREIFISYYFQEDTMNLQKLTGEKTCLSPLRLKRFTLIL